MTKHREVIQQLKWFYGALAGVCAAFFFTLLGSEATLTSSNFLLSASACFAICLPTFTAFTIAHVVILEIDVPPEKYEPILQSKRIVYLTNIALFVFAMGFASLIGHFSKILFILTLIVTVYILIELKMFYDAVS